MVGLEPRAIFLDDSQINWERKNCLPYKEPLTSWQHIGVIKLHLYPCSATLSEQAKPITLFLSCLCFIAYNLFY